MLAAWTYNDYEVIFLLLFATKFLWIINIKQLELKLLVKKQPKNGPHFKSGLKAPLYGPVQTFAEAN